MSIQPQYNPGKTGAPEKEHAEPDQEIWNRFWRNKKEIDKVYPSSPSVLKTISTRLNVKGMKILEVGAGSGRDSIELTRLGAQVTVLDFAQESLQIISKLKKEHNIGNEQLSLIQADAFFYPLCRWNIRSGVSSGLAEHFRNPLPLLRKLSESPNQGAIASVMYHRPFIFTLSSKKF